MRSEIETASPPAAAAPTVKKDPHRNAALACAGLIGTAVLLVGLGRHDSPPRQIDAASVVDTIDLAFEDLPDGTVIALDARTGVELDRIVPGRGGFVRVTMRSFANERRQRGLGSGEPFTLTRIAGGDLVLQDRLTGRSMLLDAFGPSNAAAFARLLEGKTQGSGDQATLAETERTTR